MHRHRATSCLIAGLIAGLVAATGIDRTVAADTPSLSPPQVLGRLVGPGVVAGVPPIAFATSAAAPGLFAPITVHRGSESLTMGYGQVPLAGFSDGECSTGALRVPRLCSVATGEGCLPGATCEPSPTGFCIE